MKKLDDYRGYHPLEFVILQYNRYKNFEISDSKRDQEIANFLFYYLLSFYTADVIESKDLFLSDDKESQLLGLQICCRDFIDTFNLIVEISDFIADAVINSLRVTIETYLA